MKIAICQPAFIPPAAYFRLFAATDMFIVLDSVQFNRRWYTHRQQLTSRNGEKDWLTLPIKHTDRNTTIIHDLEWRDTAADEWDDLLRPFPAFDTMEIVNDFTVSPCEFITNSMLIASFRLKIGVDCKMASDIEIPYDLRGQDRILYLCKHFGATKYVNSPGGKALYDYDAFDANGIELSFLPDYVGCNKSIFERFANEDADDIHAEIMANL